MKISEVMNKAFVVDANIKVRHAVKIMSDKNIGCLIVLKGDRVAGVVSERDIMKNINSLNTKISSIMTKDVITIEHNESIDNAALIMAENQIKKLPVMEKGKLVGIITATDIIANSDILNEDFFFG